MSAALRQDEPDDIPDAEQQNTTDPEGASDEAPSLVLWKQGPWLDLPATKVHRAIDEEVRKQEFTAKNRAERAKYHRLQRDGIRWVQLEEKRQNTAPSYSVYLPPGASSLRLPNKTDDLSSKVIAQVTVDPPKPDAEPEGDSDKERAAAEFATRFLTADGSDAGTNDAEKAKFALDMAITDMSSFSWVYVERHHAWRPQPIMAHPQAVSAESPLIGPDGQETPDPIIRYVKDSGELTDVPAEAARQWVPALVERTVPVTNVRLLPETAGSLDEALGAIIVWPTTIGELTAQYPDEMNGLTRDKIEELLRWEPPRPDDHLPRALQKLAHRGGDRQRLDVHGKPDPDALVWCYYGYYRSCALYPDGAWVVSTPVFTARGPRTGVVDGRVVLRDVPLSQTRPMADTIGGDWAGRAFVSLYAPGDEIRAQIFGAVLEALDKVLHPLWYIPATSPIQPQQVADARMYDTPLILGSPEDTVQWEQPPQIPNTATDIIEFVSQEMDKTARLGDTAQGLETATAVSGVAKRAAIEQSLVGLSSMFQNYRSARQRVWRIKLQEASVEFSVPQRVSFKGEDGSYTEQWWTGADFGGTKDVRIALGSGTMLSPSQKQQSAFMLRQMLPETFSEDDLAKMIHGNASADVGLRDNPHRMSILREIKLWEKGPPEGWVPPTPEIDPMTGQPALGPDGRPTMAGPSSTPFAQRPNLEHPVVARVQYYELVNYISGTAYTKQPPEWRALLDQRLEQSAYAAGVVTLRAQAEAAQRQQAQAEQQESSRLAQNTADKAADREAKAHESALDREQNDAQFAASQAADAQSGAVSADLERTKLAAAERMAALRSPTP